MVYWRKWLATILAALTAFYGVGPVVASHFCHSAQTRDVGFWSAEDDCHRHSCCKHATKSNKQGIKSNCCEENAEVYRLDVNQTARKFSMPPVPLLAPVTIFFLFFVAYDEFHIRRLAFPLSPPPLPQLITRIPFLQVFRF